MYCIRPSRQSSPKHPQVFVQSDSDCFSPACSLIIKRMSTDSQEAYVLAYLNSDEVRQDPWNPAPRVLYAAERGDETIVCMERLFEFDQPPFQTVGNVIEFIRQTLEVRSSPLVLLCRRLTDSTGPIIPPRKPGHPTLIRRPARHHDGHRRHVTR